MKKIWIGIGVIVVVILVVIVGFAWHPIKWSNNIPDVVSSSPAVVATTTASTVTSTLAPLSSSSVQVGPYSVMVSCHSVAETDFVSPDRVDIYKDGVIIQTISAGGDMMTCPKAEVRGAPQYVQTNGSPYYFILPVSFGKAGTNYQYWIFNTSTQQFYCPNNKGCGFNPGP